MGRSPISVILSELRSILGNAIEWCNSIRVAPQEIQDAALNSSLLYFSIEEVRQYAQKTVGLDQTAEQDARLLKRDVCSARHALNEIQAAIPKKTRLLSGSHSTPWRSNQPKQVRFFLSRLSTITAAINTTTLLVAMYVLSGALNR